MCVGDVSKIRLEVCNGGTLIGPSTVAAEAGIASFLVRTSQAKQVQLKAHSDFAVATEQSELVQK
ncbi:hypothetical protein KDU71_22695 [Carboxylicivirga sediminis]|uniref:Uncharacterized protein n=1 Tax=Carboxylicivirga sediminis TaxID=2006564 RepID=A0A941F912_9BACT|nr:hypothetical protein [Carboxylicivirga sediminis]MBR8538397.1 hypothetical protein [Carboxylicivirga sediminis]